MSSLSASLPTLLLWVMSRAIARIFLIVAVVVTVIRLRWRLDNVMAVAVTAV